MGVKNEHEDYVLMKSTWVKCTDFMESEKAVKARGETYLPKLTEQEDPEYVAYKERTAVAMLAQRSNKAMAGMVTRKEAYIEGADLIPDIIEAVDSKNQSMHTYVASLLKMFFTTGRGATLIDVPLVESPITVAQAESQGVRPRFAYYRELDIINWMSKKINNVETLVKVVLRELTTTENTNDEFTYESVYQYRVLDLVNDRTYRQRLFDAEENQIGTEIIPRMAGKFLDYIPIVFHGGVDVQTPPLDQIVDLNLHHYQLSADEIHGLRMTALPTPYLFGEDPESDKFPTIIGPTRMIGSDNEAAKIGFLEFTGAGLGRVAAKLDKYEETIAKLSVQIATDPINQSATGASIDYASSTSSLAGMVQFLSAELTQALRMAAIWSSKDPEKVTVTLNSDFAPVSMTPQMLQALLLAYEKGTISYATFYKNLAQGEITDPHKDPEEELQEIEESMPPGMTGGVIEEEEEEIEGKKKVDGEGDEEENQNGAGDEK